MANGVYHRGYDIEINLTYADLNHPERPELLQEILQPPDVRGRELLECLEHRRGGTCKSELNDKSPWMYIRRQRISGRIVLQAAHLPITHKPTPDESDKHKAMKERIAATAQRHGLTVEVEVPSPDGRVVTDVLVIGPNGRRIGWEPQYYPMSSETVRRRSRAARENGITPSWVTNDERASLIDRAPWARVDDTSWQKIATAQKMLIRSGVRHLQVWKCSATSIRICPAEAGPAGCGRFHAGWFLPALCVPQMRSTEIDELVVYSADGEFMPVTVPSPDDPRRKLRMWVPSQERDRWWEVSGREPADDDRDTEPDAVLSFAEEDLDPSCRYGDERFTPNDPRPARGAERAIGWTTFDEVPAHMLRRPRQTRVRQLSPQERAVIATELGCPVWEVGFCMLCAEPMHRYGPNCGVACQLCRQKASTPDWDASVGDYAAGGARTRSAIQRRP